MTFFQSLSDLHLGNQGVTLKKLDDDDDDDDYDDEKLELPTTEVPKKYLLQCAFRNQNQALF